MVEALRAHLDAAEQAAQAEVELQQRFFPESEFEVEYQWVRHTRLPATGGAGSSFAPGVPSPARVLALVAAHRAILDLYEDAARHVDLPPGVHDGRDWDEKVRDEEVAAALEQVVRRLAEGYADRDSSDESQEAA